MAVTKEQALTATRFKHLTEKYVNGRPKEVRRTGKTKTWKTRPDDFSIPVKYGMYESFHITQDSAQVWDVA